MSGLFFLGLATLVFAYATTVRLLLAARIFQGLASSFPATIGITLMVEKVGPRHIGEALGWTTLGLTIGFFTGPILGGFLYEFAGYDYVFLPAYLLVLCEIILRALIIEGNDSTDNANLRLLDEENSTAGSNQAEYGAITTLSGSVQTLGDHLGPEDSKATVSQEASYGSSMPSIFRLLLNPSMVVCMCVMMIVSSFNGALEGVLPLYCKEAFSFTSSQAALIFIPSSIPLLLSPWVGRLVDVSGAKRPSTFAFLFGMITFAAMSTILRWSLVDALVLVCSMLSFGFVSTVVIPAMMGEMTVAIDDMKKKEPHIFGQHGGYSMGFGFNHCTMSLGFLLGPIYGAVIKEMFGWSALMFFMVGLCLIAIASIYVVLKVRN
jgi:MFS family permease